MSHQDHKYDVLIVDPDITTRNRLKQAAASVVNFNRVFIVSALAEATARFKSGEFVDIVFLAQSFSQESRIEFVQEAKKIPAGQDAAYVLVLTARDQDAAKVANSMMGGADGVLFEPYSVQGLLEIAELARKIQTERQEAREKVGMQILVNDLLRQVDAIAVLKKSGRDTRVPLYHLKEMSAPLKKYTPEQLTRFHEITIDTAIDTPPPSTSYGYAGASERVRKKLEQKFIDESAKEANKNSKE